MSFANAPANIFELLSEDNEQPKSTQQSKPVVQPVKQQTQQRPSGNTTQARTENKENRSAVQGRPNFNNRGPRSDRPREFSNPEGGKEQRPRREFKDRKPRVEGEQRLDRRSGTGRGPENKRQGGGRGNWGKPTVDDPTTTNEHVPATTASTEAKTEETATETTPAATTPAAETPAQEPKAEEKAEEEDDGTLTLDDFLKQKKTIGTLPAPRQAGEGTSDADKKKWASIALVKEEKSVEQKKEQAAPKTKDTAAEIGIAINFTTPPVRPERRERREFREGGERREDRGERREERREDRGERREERRDREDRKPSGNRGPYQKRNNRPPPKLDSSAAFPALKA